MEQFFMRIYEKCHNWVESNRDILMTKGARAVAVVCFVIAFISAVRLFKGRI